MQVDRQPSPWPCVAMLFGLLLLCLTAPCYWQSKNPTDAPVESRRPQQNKLGAVYLFSAWDEYRRIAAHFGNSTSEMDPLHLWATPTIEELIATRAGMDQLETRPIGWSIVGPPSGPFPHQQPRHDAERPTADPPMSAALRRIGEWMADYSPLAALPRLVPGAVDLYRSWSSSTSNETLTPQAVLGADVTPYGAAPPRSSTVRLLAPGNQDTADSGRGWTAIHSSDDLATPLKPDAWCVPHVLMDQLQRLVEHPDTRWWAERTIAQLHTLTTSGRTHAADLRPLLEALSDSALEAAQIAEETADDRLRVELLRAHWGLARRVDCWTAIHEIRLAERSRERLALHGPLESFLGGRPQVVETFHGATLSAEIEAYEQSRDPRLGRQVVRRQRELEASSDPLDRSLADSVDRHYRNANVRVAVTGELLNRFVAAERSEVQALRDRIAGANVRGSSHVQSQSHVRLNPAEGSWQVMVEANGTVDSNSMADGGRARLRSRSATNFAAQKSILVDAQGVRLQPSAANAVSRNRLVGVTTDFDWIPLVGSFARDRAISQYQARRNRAKAEIEFKVSNQAMAQVDRETLEAVERIERQIRERLTDRLADAGVDITPIEMATTHERVVGRFRVAGDHQPGSHTPRPRALSDSLASVQVHETALTNAAASLSLNGTRYSGSELQEWFRTRFPRMAVESASVRRDAEFHFAQEDALQFHINDGRLELTLALANVQLDGRNIRNAIIHAYYVPAVDGLEAELVRDGSLGVEGRLSSADRARLHNVFNTVLSPERRLPVLRLDSNDDPRLEGLMITQLVLEDGWLGLAVGPASSDRVAERSRSLR